jgi:VanZ family protein
MTGSLRWLLAAGALLVAAMCLSHLPQNTIAADLGSGAGDKPAHTIVYGLLTWLLLRGCAGTGRTRSIGKIVLLVAILGAADEITQPWVGRTASLLDWLADLTGIVAAVALYYRKAKAACVMPVLADR